MLPEGWSWDYNKEGETLLVWKTFPKYALNLETEPRIKLIDMVSCQFEAKGKELNALMKNAEKNCKTLEYKNFSQDQEDLMAQVIEIRRIELANKSGQHWDDVKNGPFGPEANERQRLLCEKIRDAAKERNKVVDQTLDELILETQQEINNCMVSADKCLSILARVQDNLNFFNFKWIKSFNQFVIKLWNRLH